VVTIRAPRPSTRTRRVAHRAATTAAAVALVLAVRVVLGPWVAAGLVAVAAVVALIAGWAALEARIFDRPPPSTRVPAPGVDHAAFARALAAVAAAYLTECARQESRR
jgi:hypothetical protein